MLMYFCVNQMSPKVYGYQCGPCGDIGLVPINCGFYFRGKWTTRCYFDGEQTTRCYFKGKKNTRCPFGTKAEVGFIFRCRYYYVNGRYLKETQMCVCWQTILSLLGQQYYLSIYTFFPAFLGSARCCRSSALLPSLRWKIVNEKQVNIFSSVSHAHQACYPLFLFSPFFQVMSLFEPNTKSARWPTPLTLS